jgi:hypothetical protein
MKMKFLVDAMITNNTTGRSIRKAFTVDAADSTDATIKAFDYKGGAESIIVIRTHTVSDFSHPMD